MYSTEEVRYKFIDFFQSKGHYIAPATSVVPTNDPTLLFINAGMNQFKDVFLGKGSRPYTKAINSQPCIRVSGKHNDLEEVGHDTYHHTLFEMLGNWSFGDYYKKKAILWAWELLTKIFKIPKEKLYATIYQTDDESANIWAQETDIDNKHILRFDEEDNFWEMGETGPCGPCSEIHIDLGEGYCDMQDDPKHNCFVNEGCSRYIELWNLVFIQYNRDKSGELIELPEKHVDTGAGLERLTAVLNKVKSNYDIDIFKNIIEYIEKISDVKYSADTGIPHRVIADHIRTLVFAIADGAVPSNEGRGYVLRRILRRAIRYGRKLGFKAPFFYKISHEVVRLMGDAYPNLVKKQNHISEVIKIEEENFFKTLETGIELFTKLTEKIKDKKKNIITGKDAFKLYDTYGFPVDLTIVMAKELDLKVDVSGFEAEMNKQKERARANSGFSIDDKNRPKGGEAIIAKNETEKIEMARNHSATHLLQAALREVLGEHVYQSGSMVSPEKLRFDFSHPKALTETEISAVEKLVNSYILDNTEVCINFKAYQQALDEGALAIFSEKYEKEVRVVQINSVSTELCGGTHVNRSGDIGLFKITSESAISNGIRRIEALTGSYAIKYMNNIEETLKNIAKKLKNPIKNIPQKIEDLEKQIKEQKKTLTIFNQKEKQNIVNKELEKSLKHRPDYYNSIIDYKTSNPNDLKDICKPIASDLNIPTAITAISSNDNYITVVSSGTNQEIDINKMISKFKTEDQRVKGGGKKTEGQIIWPNNYNKDDISNKISGYLAVNIDTQTHLK